MKKTFAHLFPAALAAAALTGAVSVASAQSAAPAPAPAPAAAPAAAPAVSAGNAAAGEKKAAMCIGCHGIEGYQASFPEIHKVPMIGGQSAGYIAAALVGYQKGDKGGRHHPTMRAIAASLTKQDIADLSAFYAAQKPASRASSAPPAPANVATLVQACAACHGADFNKPIADQPKLAGQHADYLYVALKSYQVTHNPNIGRGDATMATQVKGLSHVELKAIAKYIASLPGDLTVQPQSRFR